MEVFSRTNDWGRAVNLSSNSHLINVLSKPASYPTNATWLPSSNLELEETWSGSLQELKLVRQSLVTLEYVQMA